jgi:hypothetical protein
MCIIVVKNAGIPVPSKDVLRNCFSNNSDGAGFALSRKGAIHIVKGFMGFNRFLDTVSRFEIKEEESAVYHFRIATHGKTNKENCHPFPVTDDVSLLCKEYIKSNELPALSHNGIISISTYRDMSDTATFVKEIIGPKEVRDNLRLSSIRRLINKFADTKLAILFPNGDIDIYGNMWEIDYKGLLFSNSTYKYENKYENKRRNKHSYSKFYPNTFGEDGHYWDYGIKALTNGNISNTHLSQDITNGTSSSLDITVEDLFTTEPKKCPYCFSETLVESDPENDFTICGMCGEWWDSGKLALDKKLKKYEENRIN